MEKSKKIFIPKNINYLSDDKLIDFKLPNNCIFDKGKVGCGGTSVAIESDEPYIIAVPYVDLIRNKVQQYPNLRYNGEVYGFYGKNNLKKDLVAYLKRVKVPKIVVTYDSLKKLSKWINSAEYNILIDELHLLFTEYSYRSKAVKEVLEIYTKFKNYCFMTATPLEEEFILDELKDIPVVEAVWNNTKTVTVQSVKVVGKVKTAVINLINNFKNNKYEGNAYFFVNSVSYIKDIVAICELNDENTRVIYSDNNKTDVGIKRGYTIDKPKKINLITSTAFEGSDIYDEDGLTFIVSDSAETHTLIDISTKFQQIAGRIRNSKYSNVIYHIYKNTRYSELSYEEFSAYIDQTIEETKRLVNNNTGENYVKKFPNNLIDAFYLQKEGTTLIFDPNKVKIDLYNFKICRNIYSLRVNLNREYEKYNFKVEHYDYLAEDIMEMSKTTKSFKEYVLDVQEEMDKIKDYKYYLESGIIKEAYEKYPFLERAIEVLGFEEIEQSNYIVTNIKEKLIRKSDIGLEAKILKLLDEKFKPVSGDFVKAADVKAIFNNIYRTLDINKTSKSTDILKYYDVKNSSKRIDGTLYKGYIIYKRKMIIKN